MHFQLDRQAHSEIKDDLGKIIVETDHTIPAEKLKDREDLSKIAAYLPVKVTKKEKKNLSVTKAEDTK